MRIYISCDGEQIEKEIIMKEWREVLVDEVSKKNVIDTLLNTDTTAFNGLNPIDLSETYKSTFQELSCIENWIKIY